MGNQRLTHPQTKYDGCLVEALAKDPVRLEQQAVTKLVQEAMEDTSELLGNLGQRQANLATRRQRVQSQIDALVEGLSQRIMPIKSVGVKIVELEEQKTR